MEKKGCSCGCGARVAQAKEKFNDGLKKDAKAIVTDIEGYSKADKAKRSAEVKAAFPPKTVAKTAAKATAKPAAKKPAAKAAMVAKPVAKTSTKVAPKAVGKATGTAKAVAKGAGKATAGKMPTPAGISKGPHSGDLC